MEPPNAEGAGGMTALMWASQDGELEDGPAPG
jgi:hypothetical protein